MKATYDVERAHSIYEADGRKVFTFWNDARWMEPIEMKAGDEKVFYVELDLGRENISPDWSVTTWGEKGSVQITVDGKESSNAFPYVKQDHSKLPENEGREDDGEDETLEAICSDDLLRALRYNLRAHTDLSHDDVLRKFIGHLDDN